MRREVKNGESSKMSYLFDDFLQYAINTAVFFAVFLLLYTLCTKLAKAKPGRRQKIVNAVCLLYLAFLAGVLLVPPYNLSPFFFVTNAGDIFEAQNLVPLRTIARQVSEIFRGQDVFYNLANLAANAVLFIPPPICVKRLMPRMPKVVCFLLSVLFSAMVEVVQYCTGGRIADIDDLLLNTLGAAVGFVLLCKLEKQILTDSWKWQQSKTWQKIEKRLKKNV